MTDKYEYVKGKYGGQMKLWNHNNPFEDQAMEQLHKTASMPFIFKHLAGMPDVHLGKGATIGSVIATKKAIIPAAVGVDIGCGMQAVKLSITAEDLPDNLLEIRRQIEQAIQCGGLGKYGGFNPKKRKHYLGYSMAESIWNSQLYERYQMILDKHPKIETQWCITQLGSLGTGNHFIEMCLDESGNVWLMLHSGSRGLGNRIGSYFIDKAKEACAKWHVTTTLPDDDLAYLPEETELFDDYMDALGFAQDYAKLNRKIMMDLTIGVLRKQIDKEFTIIGDEAIDCHHNYVSKEHHFNENIWVTRKGAVSARVGQLGIIPSAMGKNSFIVEGLGNADSFQSCSHGAGRVMSRTKAKQLISLEDHVKATDGVECRKDSGVIDESPAAYKDIDVVMEAQTDLVKIKEKLKAILNVKG